MFTTIFKYELKYWLRQPSIYIYAFLFLALSWTVMGGMAGESIDRWGGKVLNSAVQIHSMASYFNLFVYFLLPAIIGMSVYRDFKSNVHTVLYSYPFSKNDYLFAKFLSSFFIVTVIACLVGIGFFIGTLMPWANPELIKPLNIAAYLQVYFVFTLPNLLLFGAIIFALVTYSRNIYTGFIAIIVLVLLRAAFGSLFSGMGNEFMAGLVEPLGGEAVDYHTRYWTVAEKNDLLLPVKGVVIYNRILWLSIAAAVFVWAYQKFDFNQNASSFGFKKKGEKTVIKNNFGNIIKIALPKVDYDFSFLQRLKTTWQLSNIEFKYIVKSPLFISLVLAGLLFIVFGLSMMNPRFDTEIYPMTWLMLKQPTQFFSGIINLITFLYAGILINRARTARSCQLVDICPVPNWMLLFSKLLALIKMQAVLLSLVMIGGIATQVYHGFYQFEIRHYLFELYGLNLIHFIIWACMALFIQSLFTNPYLGFSLLLLAPIGFISLSQFGPEYLGMDFLEQGVFRYNQGPGEIFGLPYSDMDGYGAVLPAYFIYKIYWLFAGLLLLIGALLFWVRGLTDSFVERLRIARSRFKGKSVGASVLVMACFLCLGSRIYYEYNIANNWYSSNRKKELLLKAEKKYKHYTHTNQPKIISAKIDMDIYPELRQFKAKGQYWLVNKSNEKIDTLLLSYMPNLTRKYYFNKRTHIVNKDTIADLGHFDILALKESLLPGDSLKMNFEVENDPLTWLRTNTYVKANGTYIEDDVFPRFGNWLATMREMLHIPSNEKKAHPADSIALAGSYVSKDSDHIEFEAIVSTSENQVGIAPGLLIKEWSENGRRYFHYKPKEKIKHSFLFMSGKYELAEDNWQGIPLKIYYHKDHAYNIDRMMDGMKAGLAYCTENFSLYQFKQLKIVEFSQTGGASAHAFPSVIPTGEEAGFIQYIDDSEDGEVDVAFGTAVHETAHQWWAHQVVPTDALGAKVVIESMAEYVNVMVKKQEKGIGEARKFLQHCLHMYLQGRSRERKTESPLLYTRPDQNYIHYTKGALAFYALSEYIGEKKLNKALKAYVEKTAFQEDKYTTSIELLDFIKKETPDSLHYLIKDLFETITLYDNSIENVETTKLHNGQYQVEIEFNIRKYRNTRKGDKYFSDNNIDSLTYQSADMEEAVYSLPLADYIEIGIFGEKEVGGKKEESILYFQKHKVNRINNKVTIIVDQKPTEIGVDPYILLIDVNSKDNRKKI